MLVIGERINGMYGEVGTAIAERNGEFIQNLAKKQIAWGSNALDISVGPVKGDNKETMRWLVEKVQEVTDLPLSIDSPHPEVLKAGIEVCRNPVIINSIKLAEEHINLLPIAKEKECKVICLLMDEKGIPTDGGGKIEIAAELLTRMEEYGIAPRSIYFDPILLPVANAQKDVAETFALMDMLKNLTDPPPHMIVGLSNLSQKTLYRSLLNRTFLAMAISHGLDGAILDPLDEKLMKTLKTAEILMNHELYARSYLKGF